MSLLNTDSTMAVRARLSMSGRSLCRASFVFRVRALGLGFCVRVRVRVSITGSVS